ncbi:lycopene beta-cyclase CrtY [Enterobacteriaceae bacterium ET-AT1-13]|nr:lycopene beta-cyclase CrtY [Enterobacteriaceae bacterium ET-AT1-13]WGS66421.1 lycopene beta-cyclase CrtY [Enterobacteriaceae bacterium Cmel17]WMC17445.1 MAG: lycopene beta-cyclase CrtY [Enterobacteriaceae bacterium Cmel21]WMC17652.1 MAG: lycopene beta-cyclase CrtY [Enterobacteriaceae bacterium PSmelAO3-2]WMC17856.1 MAG: lycopene beta-cyclase CrtY [Enterobacteriaceae bacterium PSmelAO3-1]WMC18060.1 MAG: lycopene beta-cyclase CrtY [Enterobacteriaceae bacterium PSmelAO1]
MTFINNKYDIIFIGAGLSNSLIALNLLKKNLKVLIIDSNNKLNNNHTWSFFENIIFKNKKNCINKLIFNKWNYYKIKFPNYTKIFKNNYFCIKSNFFFNYLKKKLKQNLILNTYITNYGKNFVQLSNGNILYCNLIIDGRGYYPKKNEKLGMQLFLGQEWILKKPHNLIYPIIMDSTICQKKSFHFIYIIPLSKYNLLIEDTHYINNNIFKTNLLRNNIFKYIKKKNWIIKKLKSEEQGIIPIKLKNYKNKIFKNIILNGLKGNFFHATTGYSLYISLILSNKILKINNLNYKKILNEFNYLSKNIYKNQKKYILLNKIFFLLINTNKRYKLIQKFYNLPEILIKKFYIEKINCFDIIKFMSFKPPISYFKIFCFLINKYFI